MSLQSLCYVCQKVSSDLKRCSRCHIISYCSVKCQGDDWNRHKGECTKGEKPNFTLREEVTKWYELEETRAEIAMKADETPDDQHLIFMVSKWKEKVVELVYVSIEEIKQFAGYSVPASTFEIPNLPEKIVVLTLVPEANFAIFMWRFRKDHNRKYFELEFQEWSKRLFVHLKRQKHLLVRVTDWKRREHQIQEVELSALADLLAIEDVTEEEIIMGFEVPEKGYQSAIRFVKQ